MSSNFVSRKKRTPEIASSEETSTLDAPLYVWLFIVGALIYALWYFAAPMPWTAPEPGQAAYEPSRGQLISDGILLLPETFGMWFGGGQSPLGVFDRLGIALMAIAMLLFSFALGEFLLFRLSLLRFFRGIDGVVLRLATGLMLLSWSTGILGQCGLLQRPIAILLALAILFVVLGMAWKKHLFDQPKEEPTEASPPANDQESWFWLVAAAPLVLFVVGVSMLPPIEYDVIEYHLQVPKEWYAAGQIRVLPHNIYSGMPMGAEMWALLPMVFQPWESDWYYGALAGKLVMGLFTLLTAGLLYGSGKRLSGIWAGRAAALSAIAVPWLIYQSGTGLVDGVWAFYTLAAVYPVLIVLTRSGEQDDNFPLTGLAILSGLMAGMAFSVKYPALLMAVLPVLGLWIFAVRTDWKTLGMYTIAVTVIVAPWLVKNTIATHNPVYPLAGNLFPEEERTADQIQQWNQAHQVPPNGAGNTYSVGQLTSGIGTFLGRSPWAGITIVPLAIAALWLAPRRLSVPLAILLAVCWIVWWGFSHRLERFLIPAIPLGCLLAGLGAQQLSESSLGRYALRTWLILGLLCGFTLANQYRSIKLDPRIFVSLESLRESYTTDAIAYLNEHSQPGDVVLATGDAALFYLQPPVLYHTCFDDPPLKPLVWMTATERRQWLEDHHIQWIYVDWAEIERFRSPGNYGFPEEVTRELFAEMVDQGVLSPSDFQLGNPEKPAVVIYRVSTTGAP